MKNWRQLLVNERGMALALALIIMVIMTALAVGLAAMGGVESRISASQSAGSRARLLAESGIEYAFLSLAASGFTTKLLAGSALIPAGTTLPGLTAASGTFGVTIRNDINAGDALLTGAGALDTLGTATLDLNGIVVLTSTGTVDGATRIVVAVVQRGNLHINAALTLPGVQADTTTDSPCQNPACPPNPLRNYSIDGRDWLRTDTTTPSGTEYPQAWGRHEPPPWRRRWRARSATPTGATSSRAGTRAPGDADARGSTRSTRTRTLTPADIQKFMTNLAREPRDADHPEHPSMPVRGGGRRPQQAGGAPHDLHGARRAS